MKIYQNLLFFCRNINDRKVLELTQEGFEDYLNSPEAKRVINEIEALWASIGVNPSEQDLKSVKEKVNVLKKRLMPFFPQGHSMNGLRKMDTENPNWLPSYWVMMDYDHIDNPRDVWETQLKGKIKELKIALSYISPSGKGLKVLFLRPENLSIKEAQRWFADMTGLMDYDTSTFEVNRAHFLVPRNYILHYNAKVMFDTEANNISYTRDLSYASRQALENLSKPTAAPGKPAEAATTAAQDPIDLPIYHGLSLVAIRDKFIEIHFGGQTPKSGSRNSDTFRLAVNLRYVCNFDRDVLNQLIPCYDGFPLSEKLETIDNALKSKRYSMPKDMEVVISALHSEQIGNSDLAGEMMEVEEEKASFYNDRLKQCFSNQEKQTDVKFPMGLADSFDGLPENLRMPAIVAICPMIGALATYITLNVHGDSKNLNQTAYVVGAQASGKSNMDDLYKAWMSEWILLKEEVNRQELNYQQRTSKKQLEKEARKQFFYRIQALRTSTADVIRNLSLANGKHLFSFSQEADQLSFTRKGKNGDDLSVLIRLAYDSEIFDSHYAGVEAINGYVKVLWNMVLCTTPDGLYRSITNYTDGEVTRASIARLPDNTFMPLVIHPRRKEKSVENIKQVAKLLELMKGNIVLPKLEERAQQWLETIRKETAKVDDKARYRFSLRNCVSAMRQTTCIMLCGLAEYLLKNLDKRKPSRPIPKWSQGCETAEEFLCNHPQAVEKLLPKLMQQECYLSLFEVIADYLLDNSIYYFGSRMERAMNDSSYRPLPRERVSANNTIFDNLGQVFTMVDVRTAKAKASPGYNAFNASKLLVKRWRASGLCEEIDKGKYKKL